MLTVHQLTEDNNQCYYRKITVGTTCTSTPSVAQGKLKTCNESSITQFVCRSLALGRHTVYDIQCNVSSQ